MARDNETNTLELHIKVNGQNLSAISEKCNIGTLRIPSDPSWPKIPPRRSSNNTDDIIEPPCVITLTETPRKSHSVAQTVASRHLKSRISQRYEATHIPKRLPGCFDPRFKRQTSRQKAEKPDESRTAKNDEQTPELDTRIAQGTTKKLENKLRETDESVNGYTPPCHDVDNLLSSVGKLTNPAKTAPDYLINEQSISEAKHSPTTLQYTTNERYDVVGSRFPQEQEQEQKQKQETNRSLLLMVNEKRIHALPINTVNREAAPSSVQSPQCYSLQIPVVAYRDVPLQISSMLTQMEEDIKIPSVCENDVDGVKNGEAAKNICTSREIRRATGSTYSFRESKNEIYPLDNVERCNVKSSDDICISMKNSISKHCDGHDTDKEEVNSNVSLNRDITNEITRGKDRCENFDALDNVAGDGVINNGGTVNSNLNAAARLKNLETNCQICCVTDSRIANGSKRDEREMSSERKMAKTWMRSCVNTRTQNPAYRVKDEQDDADKPSTSGTNDKMLDKSKSWLQSLALGQASDKECSKSNKGKASKHGELRINARRHRKTAPMNLSRKAKSFFRKKSRLAITDSDCTLILPGYRGIKGNRYEKTHGRSKVSQSLYGRNGINSTNSISVRYNASKQGRINSRSLTNLRTGNSVEKPLSIPLETRELLNKSYWEYYWKLRRKITTSAKPDKSAKERDECLNEDHLPESQTLRQCSVLSCMINTALRDSTRNRFGLTADGRPSNTRENVYEASRLPSMLVKRKDERKKMKRTSERLLGPRTIALLCIAMYVAVIFLPMMYDYFFEEEYDDENVNYIELTFQYVASSFGEALDGIRDVLTTILLRPVKFDRKR